MITNCKCWHVLDESLSSQLQDIHDEILNKAGAVRTLGRMFKQKVNEFYMVSVDKVRGALYASGLNFM